MFLSIGSNFRSRCRSRRSSFDPKRFLKLCQKQINYQQNIKGASVMAERKQEPLNGSTAHKVLVSFLKKAAKTYFVHYQSITGEGYKTLMKTKS
jgi:hypothetical protein